MHAQGTTVLLVERNVHHALALADRGYVLESGRVVLSGKGADLLVDPNLRKAYLGGQIARGALCEEKGDRALFQ